LDEITIVVGPGVSAMNVGSARPLMVCNVKNADTGPVLSLHAMPETSSRRKTF
jgi:hypothetical protein